MQVRKRAAAALKKTKALHEAQLAELRSEVETTLKVPYSFSYSFLCMYFQNHTRFHVLVHLPRVDAETL